MSVGQGTAQTNLAYFTSMATRANAATTCAELQQLHTDITASVGQTLGAVSSQLTEVTTQLNNLATQITGLQGHVATLAASQTANTSLATVGATAAAVSDLASSIAFIHAVGLVHVTVGNTSVATLIKKILDLGNHITTLMHWKSLIQSQVNNLTAQVSTITSQLSSLQSTMTSKAASFPSCTL